MLSSLKVSKILFSRNDSRKLATVKKIPCAKLRPKVIKARENEEMIE